MSNFTEIFNINQQLTEGVVTNSTLLEVQKMWRIFYADSNSIFELRALWPKGVPSTKKPIYKYYRTSEYPSLDACKNAFELDALALNAKGFNIYTVMNPISSSVGGEGATKDADIRYRDLLLVDIDRTGETSEPATDSEVAAAKALAIKVRLYMASRGWPAPHVMMSGNGYHLYYLLEDVCNDKASTDLVKSVLNELSSKFNNAAVSIDTSVYNAARITKVPGTIMRKGMSSDNRPYRMAEVCDDL
jgi:hypothetical protein